MPSILANGLDLEYERLGAGEPCRGARGASPRYAAL